MQQRTRLGVITSGSLNTGLTARLEARESVEDMRVGQFVVVNGEKNDFFSMITDVALEATNQKVLIDPPKADAFIQAVLAGTATYGTLQVRPQLMLPHDPTAQLSPVKTIPRHFSALYEAQEADFSRVFGEADRTHFEIGKPLDMEVPVCIDLERLIERSNGIFGKSGTGKSFLTRLLLCGTIQSGIASNLIFDMHNEYGRDARAEGNVFVKSLRQLFGSQVQVYTLDPDGAQHGSYDGEVVIGLNQIEIEDVIPLQDELNLSSTAGETASLLADHYKDRWLTQLLDMDSAEIKEFAEAHGAHAGAIGALKRKLAQISRLKFIHKQADFSVIDRLIDALAAKRHVVLEFGQHSSSLAYMLVANIITRRIHRRWMEKSETYNRTKNAADRPHPLMITIEEAHKFLNPTNAKQTIFGMIAREMRKYSVTLLVVDQRPSSIDNEVMSQIGTRITALLNDERDIDAVFTGVSGGTALKAVLATLDSKQQALVLGHAVPMPVVVRTRPYDEAFYKAMQQSSKGKPPVAPRTVDEETDDLFPD